MKNRKIILSVLFLLISNLIIAQNNSWKKINKVQKNIKNITYTFPAEVNKKDREIYIKHC